MQKRLHPHHPDMRHLRLRVPSISSSCMRLSYSPKHASRPEGAACGSLYIPAMMYAWNTNSRFKDSRSSTIVNSYWQHGAIFQSTFKDRRSYQRQEQNDCHSSHNPYTAVRRLDKATMTTAVGVISISCSLHVFLVAAFPGADSSVDAAVYQDMAAVLFFWQMMPTGLRAHVGDRIVPESECLIQAKAESGSLQTTCLMKSQLVTGSHHPSPLGRLLETMLIR
ncbi:hypothetical protein CTAM01_13355 [Colletotrichum tamarilloi]|uniref:Uncharacterized protein n=1 Tax=Colletotrichum tamarilloi TaxID=1209934 RepID=A0ABQ9QSD4_9PEZI|nr:uncharacterized protein CTAM01_13355 [Colletotrichum tamarilloi]KAK1483598.1 hypothetical protein CTAM01_13355 [Colletotrichum tamarilloi]